MEKNIINKHKIKNMIKCKLKKETRLFFKLDIATLSFALSSLVLVVIMFGCQEAHIHKFKYVKSISNEIKKRKVIVTEHTGGNAIERGAGGALVGGLTDMILGGDGKLGAIAGGLLGAATTDEPKTESYEEDITDITYTIMFSDNTIEITKNYCPYTIGDSICVVNNCH